MTKRDELMQKFGPFLIEAFARIAVEEINRLRTHVGMPTITWQQFFDEINNDFSHLEPYEWMED